MEVKFLKRFKYKNIKALLLRNYIQNFDLYVKVLLSRRVVPEADLEPVQTSTMERICENS